MQSIAPRHARVKGKSKKPPRTVRLVCRCAGPAFAFAITQDGKEDRYTAVRVPADFGTGYLVEKTTDPNSSYHVLIAAAPGRHSCECKGWLRWGRCRHVSALLALKAAGKID
jgi:hypothetical protein